MNCAWVEMEKTTGVWSPSELKSESDEEIHQESVGYKTPSRIDEWTVSTQ